MSNVAMTLTDRNGTRIGELVNATMDELTEVLNQPEAVSISINPLVKIADSIELNKTEIQIWIDGVYRACVVPRSCGGNSKRLTFQCEGILSYFAYRHFNDTVTYGTLSPLTYMEQFQIAQNMIAYAQTGTNRDRRITMATWAPSGYGRLRRWEWYDHQEVLEALHEFTEIENGFDYGIDYLPDGARQFHMYHPAKGTYRANLVLEWGRNIVDYDFNEKGEDQGTKVYTQGGSSNDVKFEQNFEDAALSAEYGVYEKIVNEGSELDLPWLLARSKEEVAAYGRPVVLPELIVKDIPPSATDPGVKLEGVLVTGDVVPVRAMAGRCRMNGDYRIVKIRRLKSGRLGLTFNEDRT